jgi:hypothetical protein
VEARTTTQYQIDPVGAARAIQRVLLARGFCSFCTPKGVDLDVIVVLTTRHRETVRDRLASSGRLLISDGRRIE